MTAAVQEILKKTVSGKKARALLHNPIRSAETVNLVYVHDDFPGITRIRKGKNFVYFNGKTKIDNKDELERIKKLVIPPAWENVWICADPNGHLQATGTDTRNRKQYKYHPLWNTFRNQTKFHCLYEFGKALPDIRKQVEKDLLLPGLPSEKVLATIVSLMERTNIRIGNNVYEKLYGSYGLTTLKDKHVKIHRDVMRFAFKGKKGIAHTISIRSKRLARIVKKCQDMPGKDLFRYIDENGNHKCIDSGMVNQYLKSISGKDFTAKDFRTWAGSVQILLAFRDMEISDTIAGIKKNIVEALNIVSTHLGNTRSVCKKYYVHPVLISLYENKKLDKYLSGSDTQEPGANTGMTADELILLRILAKEGINIKQELI